MFTFFSKLFEINIQLFENIHIEEYLYSSFFKKHECLLLVTDKKVL